MRHEIPGAHRIDLLDEARYHASLARIGLFPDELRALPARAAVVARIEVDFLLRRGREWMAIEAKSGTGVRPDDLRGLRAIEVWPVATLLDGLAAERLWP